MLGGLAGVRAVQPVAADPGELESEIPTIRMGQVEDFRNFMGAVIDENAFATQADAFEQVKASSDAEIVVGGEADDGEGYFVSRRWSPPRTHRST